MPSLTADSPDDTILIGELIRRAKCRDYREFLDLIAQPGCPKPPPSMRIFGQMTYARWAGEVWLDDLDKWRPTLPKRLAAQEQERQREIEEKRQQRIAIEKANMERIAEQQAMHRESEQRYIERFNERAKKMGTPLWGEPGSGSEA